MKLNHLNLTVSDVPAAHHFLTTYFGFEPAFGSTQDAPVAVLTDDNGLLLTLMNPQQQGDVTYPGLFHIGFVQGSRAEVDAVYQRLSEAGVAAKPAHEFHGSYTFYVKAPGGFLVEVLSWEGTALATSP
ncbi:VOC family protein [Deinococcus sp. Arct2-2]|uniref:VOC family protein n=1 Tax=Deinococcus sp. Arct2-2 TaxID=2568653 RepID=UPI0010A4E9C6|nr:VOC family protein [Deinococcus sp. Arct2-2]THF66680.1 VOC family protein [Deinococcus sp. Arct2-2]